MDCPVCPGKMKKVRAPYRTNYAGQPISIPNAEMYRCPNCHEALLTPEQADAVSVAVKNMVRQMSGLLSPEKILAIRERLKLSQTDLEALFWQGPKVVTRWENGRVIQNTSADTILQLLERRPDVLADLQAIAKIRTQAHRRYSEGPETRQLAASSSTASD
jgi:putative zinc finger/helix-turn-helix YgiT family protein